MADEPSVEEIQVPSEESLPEQEQPQAQPEVAADTSEPVDEGGVPIKNRQAEAQRKARQMEKAQRDLISPKAAAEPADETEARKIVERIAEEKVMKRLEPILARQFLMENPDAAAMIEDINRVRSEYPELAGIDRLDVAYKIAKAERQDDIIRQQVEKESREREETVQRATQAGAQGTGRTKAPAQSIADKLAAATTLEDLKELEALIGT